MHVQEEIIGEKLFYLSFTFIKICFLCDFTLYLKHNGRMMITTSEYGSSVCKNTKWNYHSKCICKKNVWQVCVNILFFYKVFCWNSSTVFHLLR